MGLSPAARRGEVLNRNPEEILYLRQVAVAARAVLEAAEAYGYVPEPSEVIRSLREVLGGGKGGA